MDYVSFADESYGDRYHSIATFSLKHDNLEKIRSHLKKILKESSINEFKWSKLKDAKYKFSAIKLIDAVWNLIHTDDARVDVIIWDMNDSRHRIKNRDDKANYERMFYHLHSQSLKRRPRGLTWGLFPDEGVGVDWQSITQCIHAIGQRHEVIEMPLFGSFINDMHYSIGEFKEVKSHEDPCCQIADLFAGISVFSRAESNLYRQ